MTTTRTPVKHVAFRTVNQAGAIIRPQILISVVDAAIGQYGIYLEKDRVEYVPELIGPMKNLSYDERWRFLGYRPVIDLTFIYLAPLPLSPPALWGVNLLRTLHVEGLASETFGTLQINIFANNNASPWRAVRPDSSWNPSPFQAKEYVGWELAMKFECISLFSAPGDIAAGVW
jgi:hypothetical protein